MGEVGVLLYLVEGPYACLFDYALLTEEQLYVFEKVKEKLNEINRKGENTTWPLERNQNQFCTRWY